ncbi:MAG TPA: hypothetical protein VNJ01_04575 [Bacteriovoracaceae bacterium]|nr:hypothetical protein [Bacteriovoracaceae bacterium]
MIALDRQNFLGKGSDPLKHSAYLDGQWGFQITEIEQDLLQRAQVLRPAGNMKTWGEGLHGGSQSWVGLDPQTLLTPYPELARICELIRPAPGNHLVDLGAGYGRLGVVLAHVCPRARFTGLELVSQRVVEGNRVLELHQLTQARLFEQDLTVDGFQLPEAEFYFIYDYGKVGHIRKTLKQLEAIADKKNFRVIARGMGTRSLIEREHPWLCDVYPVQREENFSIYSMSGEDSLC